MRWEDCAPTEARAATVAALVILALLGLTAGQAVVWYTGQFYALFFLERMLKVDGALTNTLIALALVLGTPFFIVFGWLSDKVGRKPIILAGCLLAALSYIPIYKAMQAATGSGITTAISQRNPVTGAISLTPMESTAEGLHDAFARMHTICARRAYAVPRRPMTAFGSRDNI